MKKQFKIECNVAELETIMAALKFELESQKENTERYRLLSEAIAATSDFRVNN